MLIALWVILGIVLIGIVALLLTSLETLEPGKGLEVSGEEEAAYEKEEWPQAPPVEEPEELARPVVPAGDEEHQEPERPEAAEISEVDVKGEVEEITEEELEALAQEVSVEPEIVEEPAEVASAEPEIVEEESLPPEKEGLEHLLPDLGEYEFKELPVEGEENFLLPKWMYQFFSRGDACHTLSEDGSVVLFAKVLDAEVMLQGNAEIQIQSDTAASEVALIISFEDGSAREATRFTFDLTDDVGFWSAIKLVDQGDIRLDVLSRDEEGRLEYQGTRHFSLPAEVGPDLRATIKELSSRER